MMALRRLLGHRVSVAGLLETGLWLAIPYLLIGLVLTFLDPVPMQSMQSQLEFYLPAGANLVAFGQSTALWPVLLLLPFVC